jgi:hypothetical protein
MKVPVVETPAYSAVHNMGDKSSFHAEVTARLC